MSGAKHIDMRYHVMKEKIHDETIIIKHISTKLMLADPLTKGHEFGKKRL